MEAALNIQQYEYVLFHLGQHLHLNKSIKDSLVYGDNDSIPKNKIVFKASNKSLSTAKTVHYKGNDIPLLFPNNDKEELFEWENDSIIFHHDILKSAFYLLSGYQETLSDISDSMGRFKYNNSIQHQLKMVRKPIVNYYFEVIIDAIEQFSQKHNIAFERKRMFENFGFMLTHDVDRVDYYHWRETVYKFLQLAGIKKAHIDKTSLKKAALNAILPSIFPGYKPDPWWNFDDLRKLEKQYDFKSVWYFLNRDGSPHDAKYHLEEQRIKNLISKLLNDKCEIGLHGSIKTATNQEAIANAKQRLEKASNTTITGTRQHFLKFHYPSTLNIQQNAGIKYDTTMGFAEHEGFRNSYCYPFKPFDHDANQMLSIWEFPLSIMDTTLFGYRNLSFNNMKDSFQYIIDEIKKFGGLMVLLWHNCNFDEYEYPGINKYFAEQLECISNQNPESVTGIDVLSKV
ncbi:polysaccharide deacetylase family protein [Carboxylicivirga marina]|uniref:Polysaccharide deacetylase family protein n=1 Tax=Carboxylicivirga marina TaxID=2800988 RepID=A0ABS1HLL1_9BACT|nr:polysaccharide deacetylase family protein [Carboxylicivirga marina]MBK3518556.1 polysaccharide deacetylase family protein [Carboxylicivirga marina]